MLHELVLATRGLIHLKAFAIPAAATLSPRGGLPLTNTRKPVVITTLLSLAFFLLFPIAASAQDRRDIGLVVGYPPGVALRFDVTERIAVRPELSTSLTRVTTVFPGNERESFNDSWQTQVGLAVLWRFTSDTPLTFYLGPRVVYVRDSYTVGGQPATGGEITRAGFGWSGFVGAEYTLNERFRVYGEAGLHLERTTGDTSFNGAAETRYRTFGTRTAVGVILYF